jgi:hypothetical protein
MGNHMMASHSTKMVSADQPTLMNRITNQLELVKVPNYLRFFNLNYEQETYYFSFVFSPSAMNMQRKLCWKWSSATIIPSHWLKSKASSSFVLSSTQISNSSN